MKPDREGKEKRNRNYILRILIPGIVFDVFVFLVILIYSVLGNEQQLFLVFIIFLLLIITLEFFVAIKWINQKLLRGLQAQSPEQLIWIYEYRGLARWYDKIFSKIIPGWTSSHAFSKAVARVYWGEFDLAREMGTNPQSTA
jgi:hypothetical protein